MGGLQLRATSHMRLRAYDHYTSSTIIGGKGRPSPSSLHNMLEGITEYVNAERMCKSSWIPTWHRLDLFRGYLDYLHILPLGGRPNTKLGNHGTPTAHNRRFFQFVMVEDAHE